MNNDEVILIRPAGSMLDINEAMEQCKEFKNEKELNDFLASQTNKMIKFFGSCVWEIVLYSDSPDDRIGWKNTNLIALNGMGWYFMTKGITKKESLKILKGKKDV